MLFSQNFKHQRAFSQGIHFVFRIEEKFYRFCFVKDILIVENVNLFSILIKIVYSFKLKVIKTFVDSQPKISSVREKKRVQLFELREWVNNNNNIDKN